MNKQKIVLLKGLPASGKSTWAKTVVLSNPNWTRVNKDELRNMLHAGKWSKSNEREVLIMRDGIIHDAIANGRSVIVDDTNLHPRHEQHIGEIAKELGVDFEVRFFEIEVGEAIRRDKERANSVGAKVIRRMYRQFLTPPVEPIEYDYNLPFCIVCDIDGTLALIHDRSPYDGKSCANDYPNKPVIDILQTYQYRSNTVAEELFDDAQDSPIIILVSGRTDDAKGETQEWLEKHQISYHKLYMRKTGDSRKDVVIKREIYETHIANKYNVLFVLDDRQQTVDGWRSAGLTCLQVAPGDF